MGAYSNGRDDAAWALFKRMRKAGVNRYHPDPLAALGAAETTG